MTVAQVRRALQITQSAIRIPRSMWIKQAARSLEPFMDSPLIARPSAQIAEQPSWIWTQPVIASQIARSASKPPEGLILAIKGSGQSSGIPNAKTGHSLGDWINRLFGPRSLLVD